MKVTGFNGAVSRSRRMTGEARKDWGRRIASAVMAACVLGAVVPIGAASGESGWAGVTDITGTAFGRSLAEQAIARYRAAGLAGAVRSLAIGDLAVFRDATGITIGPRGAIAAVLARPTAGPAGFEAQPVTSGRSAAAIGTGGTTGMSGTSVGASWTFVASQCFSRISDTFSWLDHCYTMYRLANDGDAVRDWFAMNHVATMQANAPWVMNGASIGSAPAAGIPQSWADWAPRSDTSGACRQILVSISSPVSGIGDPATACESWRIQKSAKAGQFAVTWDGHGQHAARELSMEIAVSVPQGGWPQWTLPASVSGSPW